MVVHAIYEGGVFRPLSRVDLPEHAEVEFDPRPIQALPNPSPESLRNVYEILSERYDGGDPEVAAKHNEHQP